MEVLCFKSIVSTLNTTETHVQEEFCEAILCKSNSHIIYNVNLYPTNKTLERKNVSFLNKPLWFGEAQLVLVLLLLILQQSSQIVSSHLKAFGFLPILRTLTNHDNQSTYTLKIIKLLKYSCEENYDFLFG